VLGTDYESFPGTPKEALIIDPGNADQELIDLIEKNDYKLLGVLITHDHKNHVHGLRTLMRIYGETDIYAINHKVQDHKSIMVKDGDAFNIGSFPVEVFSIPGHSSDSAVFKITNMIFSGDALSAGLVGTTASSYGAQIQLNALRTKIFSLPGNFVVLPGHGPPSTLEAERQFNASIEFFERNKSRGRTFQIPDDN
jgi:glyoxylase-like metal-dependent hydrolase (beta-lactamase superfamily II)